MSSPLESPEFGHNYFGDVHDDDAHVIDTLTLEVDTPPTPVIEKIDPAPLETPKRYTRLLTGVYTLSNNDITAGVPIQILPADPNRLQLRIDGFSLAVTPGNNDYVQISDENGKAQSSSGHWRLRHNKTHTMDAHNGAVYVYPGSGIATNNFEITWLSVTE